MAIKLGVLIIHGMGDQNRNFHTEFVREVQRRLHDKKSVHFEPIYWAPVLGRKARKLWKDMTDHYNLDWKRSRKFFLHYFADAAAYQRTDSKGKETYLAIHDRIHQAILRLRKRVDRSSEQSLNEPCLILVVAHSLGGHMISNYIWDIQTASAKGDMTTLKRYGQTSFERLETMLGLVTFGCNIPFFTMAFDQVLPISIPGNLVPAAISPLAKWHNFFDKDDILAWPLKPIFSPHKNKMNANQKATVNRLEDYGINAGNLFMNWNPMSHASYWTDDDFTKPVARYINQITAALI